MTRERQSLGEQGERLAEKHLRAKGMRVVARRFRAPPGEVDLVMRDGETLVFVEVKTRADQHWTEPQHAVNATKQRKLARTAQFYLNRQARDPLPCRFDVVAIVAAPGEPPLITHFPDAFVPRR
ncbi:MAG: hypothetical protein CHACPFDD_02694 [Phycisphaerae bacterium]|nr:hypothetical protein [Phycisphaerae bacterium]